MNPEPAEVLDLSPVIDTSPKKQQTSDDVPKTVEFSNYEVSSPEASDTNTIENGANMNPEPTEVLDLSPVIEGNANIELSPGISGKKYDFLHYILFMTSIYFHQSTNNFLTKFGIMIILMML